MIGRDGYMITEENTLLLVWKREEIQISFKVHKELASVLSRV